MINEIRDSKFIKFFWGLMGLYLLNLCVDTADLNAAHIPEDLSVNDQESIIEIVVEKIIGYENVIKEYDDPDTEDHNKQINFKIDLIAQCIVDFSLKQLFIETKKQKFLNYHTYLTNGFQQLDTPPPKI